MDLGFNSCIRFVGTAKSCRYCGSGLVKHGKSTNNEVRYRCNNCKKTQIAAYSHHSYNDNINNSIIKLTREGMEIGSTARYLGISTTTLLKRIVLIASKLMMPIITVNKTCEVDELHTFVKRKDKLIGGVCAYERESKQLVSFCTGTRTNKTLAILLKTLKLGNAIRIFTDGLKNYPYLIDQTIHRVEQKH